MAGWADLIESYGVSESTSLRLVQSLRTCEAAALAFCRLLDGWARGEPQPCTVGRRQAALRRAAERAETALAGLEHPLDRYLLELESEIAEGRPGTASRAPAELVEWEPVLRRAGVAVAPHRVAQAYLELAVLVRALEGLGGLGSLRVERPTGRRSGPACSTSARTCSAPPTTCARSPPDPRGPAGSPASRRRTPLHGAGEAFVSRAPEAEPRRRLRRERLAVGSRAAEHQHHELAGLVLVAVSVFLAVVLWFGWDGGFVGSRVVSSLGRPLRRGLVLLPLVTGALGGLLLARSSLPDVRPFRTGLVVLTLAVLLAFGSGQFGLGPDCAAA